MNLVNDVLRFAEDQYMEKKGITSAHGQNGFGFAPPVGNLDEMGTGVHLFPEQGPMLYAPPAIPNNMQMSFPMPSSMGSDQLVAAKQSVGLNGQLSVPASSNGQSNVPVPASGSTVNAVSSASLLQEKKTDSYFFKGHITSDGRRTGSGILISDHNGSIYVGGFCSDRRHGIGISFIPSTVQSKFSLINTMHPKYSVAVHRWNHGVISEFFHESVKLLGSPASLLVNSIEQDGVKDIHQLEQLLIDIQSLITNEGCHDPPASSTPATPAISTATTPVATPAATPVVAARVSFPSVCVGDCIGTKNVSLGSTSVPSKQYSDSTIIPFSVSQTKDARILLFTTNEQYRPMATLFVVNDTVLSSSNQLTGSILGSGFDFPVHLEQGKHYYLDIGATSSTPSGTNGTTVATSSTPSVASGFKVMLSDFSYLSTFARKQFSITTNGYVYSFMLGDKFTQTTTAAPPTMYTIGTFSTLLTPFYNSADQSISYYFTGGELCNQTPRSGKLSISGQNSSNRLKILSVVENPLCTYTVNATSKYASKFSCLQSSNGN